MAFETPWQPPLVLSAGDTLAYNLNLPDFPPNAGWSVQCQIRGGVAGDAAVAFNSVGDPTGTFHQINVLPAATAPWLPGHYILVEYAVNAVTQERHQIYYGEFVVTGNMLSGKNDVQVTTHAQRMIPILETALEKLAQNVLQETDIERTRILRAKRMELEEQLALNKEIRRNEIALQNVRNGRPSGNKICPEFNIVPSGPPIGTVTPFPID